jgi:hypothetical protein
LENGRSPPLFLSFFCDFFFFPFFLCFFDYFFAWRTEGGAFLFWSIIPVDLADDVTTILKTTHDRLIRSRSDDFTCFFFSFLDAHSTFFNLCILRMSCEIRSIRENHLAHLDDGIVESMIDLLVGIHMDAVQEEHWPWSDDDDEASATPTPVPTPALSDAPRYICDLFLKFFIG